MKDASNGWEFTPPVRLSILNPGHKDIVNRPEAEFPLSRQQSRKLFLDASNSTMKLDQSAAEEASVKFDAADGQAEFIHIFAERIELTGYFKLKLWVQSIGNNDIDLFVKTTKLGKEGNVLETQCIDVGYLEDDPEQELKILKEMHSRADKHVAIFWAEGTTGRLRVSHRQTDEEKSEPHRPFHPHTELKPLSEEEIVAIEIGMWPLGMIWEHGEKLKITVSGRHLRPELTPRVPPPTTLNQGEVVIRTGGKFDSHFLVPVIPRR
jgi:predicted acyl esterase